MSLIPDDLIEQVRDAADLVAIVGEAVPLKRTGADYRGPCPFHGGAHRNLAVIPKKGLYYCFVCHAGGDVFTWLMKRFGMDYPTAVRDVARRVGIVIPETPAREGPDPNEPLYQAVALAQEFFARRLQEAPDAGPARDYLVGREVPLALAGEWGLGYAPRGGELLDELKQLGLAEDTLLEAGLLHRGEDGSARPRFRGRLIFPIHDLRGRAVGFGGRLLGPGEPKYLNSPESRVFHKGRLLYHLHLAKHAIRRDETAVVVEGYFDVLRLAAAGIEPVVAPLGTGLSEEQAGLLHRYAKAAVLLYDSDRPGLRAAFRAGDGLLRQGVRVRVATLPPGEDPDSLARAGGAEAIQRLLRDAMDLLERKLQLLERHGWFADLRKTREALDRLWPTLRAAADPVVRDLYVNRVAERTGVSRETLEQELRSRPIGAPPGPTPAGPRARESVRPARLRSRAEAALLRLVIADPTWRERARQEIRPEWFEAATLRGVFEALVALPAGEDSMLAAEALPDQLVPILDRLRDGAGALAGQALDHAYAALADQLRDRAEFRRLRAIADPTERQRIMAQWSPETHHRYAWFRAGERGRTPRGSPS